MPVSGSYSFILTNTELLDEAFQRCLIDPANLTARHYVSARRSISLMLMTWNQMGLHQWTIDNETLALTAGTAVYNLPEATQDILDAVVRRDSNDIPMAPLSRSEYNSIPDKAQEGMPIQWVIDKTQNGTRTVTLWPVPENSTDTIVYNRIVWPQSAGSAQNNPFIPPEWVEAFCADLAWRLAQKFAPALVRDLKALAGEALAYAIQENRERTPMTIQISYGAY